MARQVTKRQTNRESSCIFLLRKAIGRMVSGQKIWVLSKCGINVVLVGAIAALRAHDGIKQNLCLLETQIRTYKYQAHKNNNIHVFPNGTIIPSQSYCKSHRFSHRKHTIHKCDHTNKSINTKFLFGSIVSTFFLVGSTVSASISQLYFQSRANVNLTNFLRCDYTNNSIHIVRMSQILNTCSSCN